MTLLRVLGFSLAVLLSYTLFANILPQVQSDPPREEEIDTGELDMPGMIAWGERLFSGKGTCTLCHNDLGRAPDLLQMDLAAALPARIKAEGYAGAAGNADGDEAVEIYLRESLLEPSAYVVPGFGKKGTDDKVSPMPRVDAAPIELTVAEQNALIAYLQELGGFEPTVPLPDTGGEEAMDEDDEEEAVAETGVEAIEKFGCSACHDLEGTEADSGPSLNGIAKRMDRAGIVAAIIDPNAVIADGYEADMMPADFGAQMRVSELDLIIDYLTGLPD